MWFRSVAATIRSGAGAFQCEGLAYRLRLARTIAAKFQVHARAIVRANVLHSLFGAARVIQAAKNLISDARNPTQRICFRPTENALDLSSERDSQNLALGPIGRSRSDGKPVRIHSAQYWTRDAGGRREYELVPPDRRAQLSAKQ